MAKSFSDLKNSRTASFKKLIDKVNQLNAPQNYGDDDRFWKPTRNKDDTGFAVIRFLPAPEGEDVPFVMVWSHGFQGPGGWYIEKSLSTIGKPDPASEYNTFIWNRNGPGDRDFVSGTPGKNGSKRTLQYYANILVVEDPLHPENNGKVFLYSFGKKIFDKIQEAMNPKYPDQKAVDPFDMWGGANFKIKIAKDDGWVNYNRSEFDQPSPAAASDEAMEAIWKKTYSLQEFLKPEKFKSYADLKKRLNKVLGLDPEDDVPEEKVTAGTVSAPAAPVMSAPAQAESPPWEETAASSTDSELDEFQKLANS